MIRISCGNLGSGKTLSEVREMAVDKSSKLFYSNIHCKLDHVIPIKPEMMIMKEEIMKGNKVTERLKFNKEFWLSVEKPISICLDEAHFLFSSRRSMSRLNIEIMKFVSMARRVCGQDKSGYGELVFITQLPYTIDKISRDLCNEVRHHLCHYKIFCPSCKTSFVENTDMPNKIKKCLRCGSWRVEKKDHKIQVFKFASINDYEMWNEFGEKRFYDTYMIKNPEAYFKLYDTYQWEDLFEDYD